MSISQLYDNKDKCTKCSGTNNINVIDTDSGYISECETTCSECDHKDYWAYGFFESKSEPRAKFINAME